MTIENDNYTFYRKPKMELYETLCRFYKRRKAIGNSNSLISDGGNELSTKLTVINVVGMMLKRWWIILLACIVGGSVFFSYNKYLVDPVYTASGSLFVNNVREKKTENVNIADMTTSQMLVWTYVELLKSNTFMSKVAENSGLEYSGTDIARMVTMASQNETEIMRIIAVTTNPQHSQIIVNTILESAPAEFDRIMKGGSTEIIDYARLPLRPSGPNLFLHTLVGIVFGAALACGSILLREILDNKVKDEDDLVQTYDFPVLGTIPNID